MAVDMATLIADLADESGDLDRILDALPPLGWEMPTPAAGWLVRDQVSHLAYFDVAARLAAVNPERFRAESTELGETGVDFPDRVARRFRGLTKDQLLNWLRVARAAYLETFAALAPATSLPWYGPPMSAASSVTARLMETWAHGQDVVDGVGAAREPTRRLRHIAHLGVATRGWSFQVRRRELPVAPVRVELSGPTGGSWTWGPAEAADRVLGPALDFCLLVTQRRHRADTALSAEGPVADAWLDIAQAFAGAPGPGRRPRDAG